MWPSRLDMSRDECRKCLRCLELDAYGNMVSVLRAQGAFTDEKQKLLGELATVLHISNERHRAEVRRAVNDEKLSIIAEQLNGPNTCTDWSIEGRRTIPLLPRLKAHTAFTGLANSLSLVIAAANEKKLHPGSRVDEATVKAETDSRESAVHEDRTKLPVLHSELNARGKKRKRSLRESPDNDKCRKANTRESTNGDSETNSTDCKASRVTSPISSPITSNQCTNVVQVSIVTPSSTADMPLRKENTLSSTQLTCSSTNLTHNNKVAQAVSTITSSVETNSSTLQTTTNSHGSPSMETNQNDILSSVVTTSPATVKNRTMVTAIQTKINPNVQQSVSAQCTAGKSLQFDDKESQRENEKIVTKVVAATEESPKMSRPDSTTSNTPGPKRITTTKLCLTTKPVITSSTSRVLAVNSGSTASSGPGPPSLKAATTLTYKKLPPGKLNHHPGSKMGITLSTNKTLKINAHPNARLAAKANVIVVQKGSSRGVTLSHGGKEVLGKVIMGGKNLCLASQKSATSVTLLPHRTVANNGDQSLTMLSTVNANHAESLKANSKTGNMIVFDIRQDVLEKNKVLSQFLEASGVFNPECKTASIINANNIRLTTKNSNIDSCHVSKNTPAISNSLPLESQEKSKTSNEPCLYSSTEAADSSVAMGDTVIQEILTDSEDRIEMHGVLDAQTGIYNFKSTDGTIIEDHVEESVPTSGLDIFSTALASADINLENFHYVNDEVDEIIGETNDEVMINSPMSTVEPLNELSSDS